VAVDDAVIENDSNMWVVEPSHRSDLIAELLAVVIVASAVSGDDLDGDVAALLAMATSPNRAHAAGANRLEQLEGPQSHQLSSPITTSRL
jgi:hypothetical protein